MTNRELTRAALRAEEGMWEGFATEERIKREQENHEMTERDDALVDRVRKVAIEHIGCEATPDKEGAHWMDVRSVDHEPFFLGDMLAEIIAAVEADLYARLTSEGAIHAGAQAECIWMNDLEDYGNYSHYIDPFTDGMKYALAHCGIGAGKEDTDAK